MSTQAPASQRSERALLAAAYLLLAAVSAWYFTKLRFHFNIEYASQAPVSRLFAFDADRPFQYRILVPALAHLVPIEHIKTRFIALEWVFSFLSVLAFRMLLRRFFEDRLLCSLLSFLLLPCLLFNFVLPRATPLWFPWDIPAVMFFSLGLLLLYDRNWRVYYPVFVLATLNRETSCFLTIVWFLAAWDERRTRSFWVHLAAQTALWLSIKLILSLVFADRGGQLVYHHIDENLKYLFRPGVWPLLLSSLAFTWIIAPGLHSLIRDSFVRRSLLCLIPYGVGMFLAGRIIETRIYGELAPLTLTATILVAASVSGRARGVGS